MISYLCALALGILIGFLYEKGWLDPQTREITSFI
jgi:hypothetical protein